MPYNNDYPDDSGNSYFGKLTRVSLNDFTATGVTFLDLETISSHYKAFSGGFAHGNQYVSALPRQTV